MNKSEFLKALSKQLKLMPKEDREDALTFYSEYLEDYASPETKIAGIKRISEELSHVPNEKIRDIAAERLVRISHGERDFRF